MLPVTSVNLPAPLTLQRIMAENLLSTLLEEFEEQASAATANAVANRIAAAFAARSTGAERWYSLGRYCERYFLSV